MPASPEPPVIGPAAAGAVRKATDADVPGVAGALARAFYDDPGWSHVLEGLDNRRERLRLFFETELRNIAMPMGLVWTTDKIAGGAVWTPPGQWRVPLWTTIREVAPMMRVLGRRLPRGLRSRFRMEGVHPKRPEHWYLAAIGVDPEWQGRGVGSALMAPALAELDGGSLPAYLEASSPRSRELYIRHGFEVSGEFNLPGSGGPPIWQMWRDPPAVA